MRFVQLHLTKVVEPFGTSGIPCDRLYWRAHPSENAVAQELFELPRGMRFEADSGKFIDNRSCEWLLETYQNFDRPRPILFQEGTGTIFLRQANPNEGQPQEAAKTL